VELPKIPLVMYQHQHAPLPLDRRKNVPQTVTAARHLKGEKAEKGVFTPDQILTLLNAAIQAFLRCAPPRPCYARTVRLRANDAFLGRSLDLPTAVVLVGL
jgi:hypothetical protein